MIEREGMASGTVLPPVLSLLWFGYNLNVERVCHCIASQFGGPKSG